MTDPDRPPCFDNYECETRGCFGESVGAVCYEARLLRMQRVGEHCACGKPIAHLDADEDSDEWACRVPQREGGQRVDSGQPDQAAEVCDHDFGATHD